MSKFEDIRRKNPKVRRNRLCLYNGHLMRISSTTDTGGLKLRREIICHPNDDNLIIEMDEDYEDYESALKLLDLSVDMIIGRGERVWDEWEDNRETISKILRRIVWRLQNDAKMLAKSAGE